MVHVAFARSPYAHAPTLRIDRDAARAMAGVVAIVTGPELATVCSPCVGVLSHMKGLKSAPQHAIAIDVACWQNEAVAAVVWGDDHGNPAVTAGYPASPGADLIRTPVSQVLERTIPLNLWRYRSPPSTLVN
jgi:hypothetical protein